MPSGGVRVKIDITDRDVGYRHTIDSSDYETIGRWLAEKARLLMSADCRINHPAMIDIWPSGPSFDADLEVIRQANLPVRSVDGLHEFVKGLLALSQAWQDAEQRAETTA
jgi:hypothetical protein